MFRKLRDVTLLAGALAFLLAACGGQKNPIAGLLLNEEILELQVGQTAELEAELEYESGKTAPVEVKWVSSDDAVATVDDGTVIALKPGEATITATHESSGIEASVEVVVTALEDEGEKPGEDEKPGEGEEPGGDEKPGETEEPGGDEKPGEGEGKEPGTGEEPGENEDEGEPEVIIAINGPDSLELLIGESTSMVADVTGTANTVVVWSVEPAGSVDVVSTGTNSATITALDTGAAVVTATAEKDPGAHASVSVSVVPAPEFDPDEVYVGTEVRTASADEGTEANPFMSLTDVLAKTDLSDDAVIHIAAGEYVERDVLQVLDHRILGAGQGATTLIAPATACYGMLVTGNDAELSGFTLDVSNLDSHPNCTWVRGIAAEQTSGLRLTDLHVVGAVDDDPDRYLAGISLWKTVDSELSGVTVRNTQRSGIELNGGTGITLEDITVINAGQGRGLQLELSGATIPVDRAVVESGFGALGFFASASAGPLADVVLRGNFTVSEMPGRIGMSIHLHDDETMGLSTAPDFTWTNSSFIDALLQLDFTTMIEPDPQLNIESGVAGLIGALGATHVVQDGLETPTINAVFRDREDAVALAREALATTGGQAELTVIELDLEASTPSQAHLKNLVAFQTEDGKYSSTIQDGIDAIMHAPDLVTEGIVITEGTYEEQLSIEASMHLTGTGVDAVTLKAGTIEALKDDNGNEFFSTVLVAGSDIEVMIADLTIDASMPEYVPPTSGPSGNRTNCEQKFTSGLTIARGAEVTARDVNVINVGGRGASDYCDRGHGITVGLSFSPLSLELGGGTLNAERLDVSMDGTGKYGIVLRHEDSFLQLRNSEIVGTVTGDGPPRQPGQNGLQISFGSAVVDGVTIRDFRFEPSRSSASGLVIWTGKTVEIKNSTLANNDIALVYDLDATEADVSNTEFNRNSYNLSAPNDPDFDLSGRNNSFDGVVQ